MPRGSTANLLAAGKRASGSSRPSMVPPLPEESSKQLILNLDLPDVSQRYLMNDWEIGGTQNKWVCPSDRHLQLRAQLKSGWSVRTATARSPTNSKATSGITDAEQEHIRQVLAKAEASKQKEQQRLGKMVDRLEKMRRRATGNGVTHCLLCHTEFGLLASKSYAAMCVDCRKYVCQRNCGVETLDHVRGDLVFLCKICSEAREVLWKKSGAWFYKEMPDFVRPELNGGMNGGPASTASPPQPKPSWAQVSPGPMNTVVPHRRLPSLPPPESSKVATATVVPPEITIRPKSPRPRIQPSWVKEKVMSSMSVDDEDRSSSEGEFAQSGVPRRSKQSQQSRREANLARFALHAQRISDSEDDSSPESRASTRSTSPRRSLATPSSYDSSHNQTVPPTHPEDARSIDSGVVQSDHSNPQQALTLSVSSLAPFTNNDTNTTRRISQSDTPPRVAQSASGTCLVTPPPIPPRLSDPDPLSQKRPSPSPAHSIDLTRNMSISSAASTKRAATSTESVNAVVEQAKSAQNVRGESPSASFMSSPDDDTKTRAARRAAIFTPRAAGGGVAVASRQPSENISQSIEDEDEDDSQPATDDEPTIREDGIGSTDQPGARRGTRRGLFSCFFSPTRQRTLGSIQFTLTYTQNDKKLLVHLIRAKNLKAMDSNGFSDPYVKLHLLPGNAKATKLTSKTIEKTLNPEWNEELVYHGITEEDKQKKTLRVTVLDRDRIGSDFLGETRIALKKLPHNATKKFNLYLEHAIPVQVPRQEEETERGKILVSLQYNIQQGSLYVIIKRCVELIGMDSTGFSDPYCKVSLTPVTSKAHRLRTSIKKRTLNPEFNETLTFVVPFKDLPKKTLQIGVYDHDLGKHDDYIGGILLSTSAKDERGKQWINCVENPGQTFEVWHKLELDS